MTDELINRAGDLTSGKEDERTPEDLVAKTRRAKLTRRSSGKPDELVEGLTSSSTTEAARSDEQDQADDVYFDALLRFGIQI